MSNRRKPNLFWDMLKLAFFGFLFYMLSHIDSNLKQKYKYDQPDTRPSTESSAPSDNGGQSVIPSVAGRSST
jgi:hypothetical protein